jgi:LemA protein
LLAFLQLSLPSINLAASSVNEYDGRYHGVRGEVGLMSRATSSGLARPLAGILILAFASALAGCGVNNIPTYEESAKAAWAEVQNQYKRRADLIGNLVETVKGFAEQEKSVLTQVTEARSKATGVQIPPDVLTNPDALKKFQDAQSSLGAALRQLMVVVERYPDIKSGANFAQLQSQLEGTENRIAIARRDYIEAVRLFNTELNTFPGRLWKAALYPDKKEMASFEATPEETEAPKVDFGTDKK